MTICISPDGSTTATGPADRVLVGTVDGIVELCRSGPSAAWSTVGRTLEGQHVSALFFEPLRGGIFAGIHGEGLFLSSDDGRTWQERVQGLSSRHVYTFASSRETDGPVIYAGTEPARLYRSRNYGESWEELMGLREVPNTDKWMFPPPPHIAHVKTIAIDSRDSRVVYVGVEQGALLKSIDGGESWSELAEYYRNGDPVYKDTHRLVFCPSNPDGIFMTSGMGLYHSCDAGETWKHLTDVGFRIGYPDQLLISPRNENRMFMAGAGSDPGKWLKTHRADALVVRSDDGGRNWRSAAVGLPENMRANITAMSLVDGSDRVTLFLATTSGEVFMSEDEAASWSRIADGLPSVTKAAYWPRVLAG